MITTCKAIVLSTVKYGDDDLIIKCYTEIGIKSYIAKRIFKSKKGKLSPAFFLPLTQLEITSDYTNNKTLYYINEAKIGYPFSTVLSDIYKQTITVFLSEVLTYVLREEETDNNMFTYIETALQWLDSHEKVANFHLVFLLNLTKYLGFYPEKITKALYFDMMSGRFSDHLESKYFIAGESLINFKTLLNTNFDVISNLKFNKKIRLKLLEIIMQYYELHVPNYKYPKSLEVLKIIFN